MEFLKFNMQKKNVLSAFICWTGLLLLIRNRPSNPNHLIILAYHRVMPEVENFPFDSKLISATPSQFEWQVKYIKSHYNLISFDDLVKLRESGEPLPERSIIITFDDGFDDNYLYAFPILKKHDAKASFFISTDYIGSDKIFWFDWVAFLCNKLQKDIVLEVRPNGDSVELSRTQHKTEMVQSCLSFLKRISDEDRKEVIKQLESAVKKGAVKSEFSRAMSWEMVKYMHDSAFAEIGSHAKSHAILSQLNDEELSIEVDESRGIICNQLSSKCSTLSYPVGGATAYNDNVVEAVKKAGYDYAVTYMPGLNIVGETSDYLLKRLHVEKYVKTYRFKAMLEFPKYLW